MKCRQAEEWMDQVLDGGPSGAAAGARGLLDQHAAACPQCRRQWELLQAADAALRVPKPVPAPAGMLAELRQRLAEEPRAVVVPSRRRDIWSWLFPVSTFAAGAAAATVVAFNLWPSRTQAGQTVRLTDGLTGMAQKQPGSETRAADTPAPALTPKDPGRQSLRPEPPRLNGAPAAGPAEHFQRPAAPAGQQHMAKAAPVRDPAFSGDSTAREQPKELDAEDRARRQDSPAVPARPGLLDQIESRAEPRVHAKGGGPDAYANVRQSPAGVGAVGSAQNYAVQQQGGFGGGGFGGQARNSAAGSAVEAPAQPTDNHHYYRYADGAGQDISPAVLTALNRSVEVRVKIATVQEAVERLSEQADVPVRVDPRVQQLRVTFTSQEEGTPLWLALETVARQNHLQILPEDNRLVLKPAPTLHFERGRSDAVMSKSAAPPAVRSRMAAPAGPPAAPAAAPAEPVKMRGVPVPGGAGADERNAGAPAAPRLRTQNPARATRAMGTAAENPRGAVGQQAVRPLHVQRRLTRTPDRAIWPAAWGTLPDRNFALPETAAERKK